MSQLLMTLKPAILLSFLLFSGLDSYSIEDSPLVISFFMQLLLESDCPSLLITYSSLNNVAFRFSHGRIGR